MLYFRILGLWQKGCVAAIGALHFSVRSFGCALFYLKGILNMKKPLVKVVSIILGISLLCSCAVQDNVSSSAPETSSLPESSSVETTESEETSKLETSATTIESTETSTPETEVPDITLPESASIDIEPLDWYSKIPSGSGITSIATVLHYYGYKASFGDLAACAEIYADSTIIDGVTPSPFEKIVFSPTTSLSIAYAGPIVNMANNYLTSIGSDKRAVDISGKAVEELLSYVAKGKPVIVWATSTGRAAEDGSTWIADNGERVVKKKEVRVYVLDSYSGNDITLLRDTGSTAKCSKEQLNTMYQSVYSQAIIIE